MLPRACTAAALSYITRTIGVIAILSSSLCESRVPAEEPETAADAVGDSLPPNAIARFGTLRLRHAGMVTSVAYWPDNKWIASSGYDGAVVIWDAKTGKEEKRFQYPNYVHSVAISPDKQWLVACTWDGISVRDTKTWKEVDVLHDRGRQWYLKAVFSPNSKFLATTDRNGSVCLWDVGKRELIHRWENIPQTLAFSKALAFSHDGMMLATSGTTGKTRKDKTPILVWNVQTHKELFRLEGHDFSGIGPVCFSPDDKTLASAGSDGMIRLWNLETKKEVWTQEALAGGLAFTSDGKTLIECGKLSLSKPPELRFRNVTDGKMVLQVPVDGNPFGSLCLSPDEKTISIGGYDHTIRLWDRSTGKEVTPCSSLPWGVMSLAYSPDGKLLASRHNEEDIRLWDVASHKQVFHFVMKLENYSGSLGEDTSHRTRTVCFSPNGKLVTAVGAYNGKCYVWDTTTGKEVAVIQSQNKYISSVVFPTNDSVLTAGHMKDGVTLWSVPDGKVLRQIPGSEESSLLSADISPDAHIIAVAAGGPPVLHVGTARRELSVVGREATPAHTVVFSPDGKLLAVAAGEGGPRDGRPRTEAHDVIVVWDVASGHLLHELKGHKGSVYNVAFSADGRYLISAGQEDRTIRLWDVYTGSALGKCEGHQGAVYAAAISPDGKFLASASGDGTILLWDRYKVAPALAVKKLSAEEVADRWSLIPTAPPRKAYPAMAALADAEKEALEYLSTRLLPAKAPDAKRIQELIRQLDADNGNERDKAQQELARLEGTAEKALRAAHEEKPSTEAKRRLETLLEGLQGPPNSGSRLEASRAVQLLETIGSPKAAEFLDTLAKGEPSATLTKEAKSALERLTRRQAALAPQK